MARHVHIPIRREELNSRKTPSPNFNANIVVDNRMNAVPGFLASAAFFTFLRANLVYPPSTYNSTTSTPILYASSSQTLPPVGPSLLATMSSNTEDEIVAPTTLDDIPTLTTAILTSEADKIAALKLVADSIAQQRQAASRAIIFHPLTLAIYITILAAVSKFTYKDDSNLAILATTCAGVTMACLVAVRSATAGYIQLAEAFNWNYAKNEDGEEDIIIGSRYGNDIIGALILRVERATNGKKRGKNGRTGGKGIVRAWTTKLRYRGTGVGTEMLEEAVRKTREKLGNSAAIGFAKEHANSKMILPEIFNGGFRKRERTAAKALEVVVDGMDPGRKKR